MDTLVFIAICIVVSVVQTALLLLRLAALIIWLAVLGAVKEWRKRIMGE